MRLRTLTLFLALAGSGLTAQEAHLGFGLNLLFPTGGFRNTTYAANADVLVPQNEGYDVGLGGQFTLSFPVDPKLAIRLNLSGYSTDGSNTATGYDKINLRHSIFSIGGELQFFTQSALRHKGTFFILGVSADFERFDRSFGDPYYDDYWNWYNNGDVDTTRKSRMGATAGIGHSFGYESGIRFTLEAAFHKTISGTGVGNPPATDFVKLSFGVVF